MRTLERTMSSGLRELACRYGDDCARTLLRYYEAENTGASKREVIAAYYAHKTVREMFEGTFPRLKWREFAEPGLLDAIERNHP